MKYYKTNNANILLTHDEFNTKCTELRKQAIEWATLFNAEPVYQNTAEHLLLYGIRLNNFDSRNDTQYWTNPSPDSKCSRPRTRLKLNHQLFKDELAELTTKYFNMRPKIDKISREDFLKSMGTSWGNLLFSGFAYFPLNGCIYIATGANLTNCTEILGSEYELAKNKRNNNIDAD